MSLGERSGWGLRCVALNAVVAGEQQEVGGGGEGAGAAHDAVEAARAWARPVRTELDALDNLKKLLERLHITFYSFTYSRETH